MAIYNGTDRYVVYYNGQRYVDSLTKPKLPNGLYVENRGTLSVFNWED
jgi:hypothetical protein